MTLQEVLLNGTTGSSALDYPANAQLVAMTQQLTRVRPQPVLPPTRTGRLGPQPQPSHQPQRVLSPNSPLRNKIVYMLECSACRTTLCVRAMRAILLADTKVELYSTDIPPPPVYTCQQDQLTTGCHCRVRETACGHCGQFVGYQVSQPCESCLGARNNGHFWMFTSESVRAYERPDPATPGRPLYWAALTPMAEAGPVQSGSPFSSLSPVAALHAMPQLRLTAASYESVCR